MFIHKVLFKIKKKDVPIYVRDCRMWKREAAKHTGYLDCRTLLRTNEKDHYASVYFWKTEANHNRFMKKNHERLVGLSKCQVQVLGYFNFKTI